MTNVRLALLSGRLSYRALFSWNTPALFFAVLVFTPVLQIVFFVLLGRSLEYRDDLFFITGNALLGATAASVSGLVGVIAEERRFGTLSTILVSPASRVAVFVGRLLPGVVLAIGTAVFTSCLGFVAVGWPYGPLESLAYLAAITVAAFSGSALGLTLSAFGLIYRDIFQIATAAQFALLLLTGANVALDRLPEWAQGLALGLPLTHAVAGVRELTAAGVTTTFWSALGTDVLVGACWLGVGLVLMNVLERAARRGASLELY